MSAKNGYDVISNRCLLFYSLFHAKSKIPIKNQFQAFSRALIRKVAYIERINITSRFIRRVRPDTLTS